MQWNSRDVKLEQLDGQTLAEPFNGKLWRGVNVIKHHTCEDQHGSHRYVSHHAYLLCLLALSSKCFCTLFYSVYLINIINTPQVEVVP